MLTLRFDSVRGVEQEDEHGHNFQFSLLSRRLCILYVCVCVDYNVSNPLNQLWGRGKQETDACFGFGTGFQARSEKGEFALLRSARNGSPPSVTIEVGGIEFFLLVFLSSFSRRPTPVRAGLLGAFVIAELINP